MKEDWEIPYKAEALGWLAVALATRDPNRQAGLIDEALALLLDRASAPRTLSSSADWRRPGRGWPFWPTEAAIPT